MHNRQSGAAHVPIMFFLILLVMFLGALGYGYVTQTQNGELIKQRDDARAELKALQNKDLLVEHYVADIGKVIGKPGKYDGRRDSAPLYNGATITYSGLMSPEEVEKVMETAAAEAGISVASSLENLLGALITKINTQSQRIKDIELERDKALADKNQTDQQFTATATEASSKARENQQNLEQARSDFEAAKTEKDRNTNTLQESLRAKVEEVTSVRRSEEHTSELQSH